MFHNGWSGQGYTANSGYIQVYQWLITLVDCGCYLNNLHPMVPPNEICYLMRPQHAHIYTSNCGRETTTVTTTETCSIWTPIVTLVHHSHH